MLLQLMSMQKQLDKQHMVESIFGLMEASGDYSTCSVFVKTYCVVICTHICTCMCSIHIFMHAAHIDVQTYSYRYTHAHAHTHTYMYICCLHTQAYRRQ